MKKHSAILIAIAVLITVTVMIALKPAHLFVNSTYIDTNSGMKRHILRLYGMQLKCTVEETRFSKLAKDFGLVTLPPKWENLVDISYCADIKKIKIERLNYSFIFPQEFDKLIAAFDEYKEKNGRDLQAEEKKVLMKFFLNNFRSTACGSYRMNCLSIIRTELGLEDIKLDYLSS